LDRDSGEAKILEVDAEHEQDALDEVFERNVVVEKIEAVGEAEKIQVHAEKKRDQLERRSRVWADHPGNSQLVEGGKKQHGDIATIAMGVFLGLFMYTLVSPLIAIFVVVIWWAFGMNYPF
jgi:hypothetical protein